jgi:hypothetical protein
LFDGWVFGALGEGEKFIKLSSYQVHKVEKKWLNIFFRVLLTKDGNQTTSKPLSHGMNATVNGADYTKLAILFFVVHFTL